MKEWRYFYHWISKNSSNIEQELNNYGKEGWELINISPDEVEEEQGYRLFFKRESSPE
jgi:hypothetical protein